MKSKMIVVVTAFLGLAIVSSAQAQEVRLNVGVRGSFGVPFGEARGGTDLKDVTTRAIPVQVDVDYRIDEHWSAGSPGPIASIPFVRAVLDYAVTVIPKEKIVLGMPFYGYDWPEKATASEVTAVKSQEMLKSLNIKPQWDSQAQSYWFKYETPEGGKRTVYYESARTLKTRLDIAREYGIAGVSIWRVGDETPDFFPPLKKYRDGK